MHYIPYNLKFFKVKLEEYESYEGFAPEEIVHEAQMLLKEILDLKDQGYMYSYNKMNDELDSENRLTNFILKNNAKIIKPLELSKKKVKYATQQIFLSNYLVELQALADKKVSLEDVNPLMYDIYNYIKRLFSSATEDTAYIFLLRDTLLPYFAFSKWAKQKNIKTYAWLIGRKWLGMFPSLKSIESGNLENDVQSVNFGTNDEVYEMIYQCLFTALDEENNNFEVFASKVSKYINKELVQFPTMKNELQKLLSTIKEKKIIIVESGRFASIPMLLRAIDKRVDFRLFTTTPQFYGVYKEKYFSKEYDKNRLFETLYCQDRLFQFAGFKDGEFMIKKTTDKDVEAQSLKELKQWDKITD